MIRTSCFLKCLKIAFLTPTIDLSEVKIYEKFCVARNWHTFGTVLARFATCAVKAYML